MSSSRSSPGHECGRAGRGAPVRAVGSLPPVVVRRLAGSPVVVDGQALDPEAQLAQRVLDLRGKRGPSLTLAERRAKILRDARLFGGPPIEVREARDIQVAGADGSLRARLYVGSGAPTPSPLLVYFHGGGWTTGDIESHDNLCRLLAGEARIRVISVEYRLAPEHRFPAAVEDALASFHDAVARVDELRGDALRVGVGGDSAGGNLAAVCAQLARESGPRPAFQLLIYPVVQVGDRSRRSYDLFGEGYYLSRSDMDFHDAHYLADSAQAHDPRVSPIRAEDLSGLPPALVIVAGFDPLRDEALEYAELMQKAGVSVQVERVPGFPHGFANAVGAGRGAPAATRRLAASLRALLHP